MDVLKTLFYIFLAAVLCSCAKDKAQPTQYVLTGVLEAGKNPEQIFIYMFDGETRTEVKDALVVLSFESTSLLLAYEPNKGYCISQDLSLVTPGLKYTLRAQIGDNLLEASTEVPEIPVMLQMSPTSFVVDPNNPQGVVFSCAWDAADTLSYLLQLKSTELNPAIIPFQDGGGKFLQSFSGPYDSNGLALVASDFEFYGGNKLSILAISPTYRNILLQPSTDDRNFLLNGPDNVVGGLGFFTAVSSTQVSLDAMP